MDRAQLLNDAEEAQRTVLDGRQSCIWTAMPGIVQSVNFEEMTCEVQPSLQGTVENENGTFESVNLPLLVDVPIVFPSGGGFLITLPIGEGDEVLVVFASRCIDAWWQSGGIQRTMEARMHDMSDGFAIPGPRSKPKAAADISETDLQIRNDAGTVVLGITGAGKISMKNTTKAAKTVFDGMLTLLNTLVTDLNAFSTTTSGDPIAVVTAGAAAALLPTLSALALQIAAYKTDDIGGLFE